MKKSKGFTLIELLAVIVILALILMLVVPNVLKSYNNSKKNLYDIMVENICRASNMYFEEYQEGLIREENNFCITTYTTRTCNMYDATEECTTSNTTQQPCSEVDSTHSCNVISITDSCNIKIQKLMNEKYLDENLENPLTEKPIDESEVSIIASTNQLNAAQKDSNGMPIYTYRVTIDNDETICNQ